MALTFELAGAQIDGARKYQEDAFLITHLTDQYGDPSALVIVADGMGGHAAGNVASNMAVQAFAKHVSTHYPTENLATVLRDSVLKANQSIQETIKETPALAGMGCTIIAAILEADSIWWASVGDSHLYVVRDAELMKKNDDHSYGGFLDRMETAGTPVEPQKGLARNMLMSALTGDKINEINAPEVPFSLLPNDRVLLCSDGIDTLSTRQIIQNMSGNETPKGCSESLLAAVVECDIPKQDNTTAVVAVVKAADRTTTQTKQRTSAPVVSGDITQPREQEKKGQWKQESGVDSPAPWLAGSAQTATDPAGRNVPYRQQKKAGSGIKWLVAVAVLAVIGGTMGWFFLQGPDKSGPVGAARPAPSSPQTTPRSRPSVPPIAGTIDMPTVGTPVVEAGQKTDEEAPATNNQTTLRDRLASGGEGPVMVIVPGGRYRMGSSGLSQNADERPQHTVIVGSFAVSQYEITAAEYTRFAKQQGLTLPDKLATIPGDRPVHYVSWDDAHTYARWLSKETGQRYRLLSEAEWEYMAGYGGELSFWWGREAKTGKAHCFDCESGLDPRRPARVGFFPANVLNIHDTAGNVSEWVHDCWHDDYTGAPSTAEVWEGGDCNYRVVRGGSYADPLQSLRTAKRTKMRSRLGNDLVGIRMGRDL